MTRRRRQAYAKHDWFCYFIGFMLLELRLQVTVGRVLARTGAVAYLFGAILVAVAEALE